MVEAVPGQKEMVNMGLYEELGSFLGVDLDSAEFDPLLRMERIVEKLEAGERGFEGIMDDEKPFLFLDKGVVFEDRDGKRCIATFSTIPEEECRGHIRGKKMQPHIHFDRIMALSGRLLTAFETLRNEIVPEALEHGKGGATVQGENLKYLSRFPGKVFAFGRLGELEKRRSRVVDNKVWLVTPHGLASGGYIDDIVYNIIPRSVHDRLIPPEEE